MRRWIAVSLLAAAALTLGAPAGADKPRRNEAVWVAPDAADYDVRSIAFLPVATYDRNPDAERATEVAVAQALRGSGHRWISPMVVRTWLTREGGDSLVQGLRDHLLRADRLDSTRAPALSRITRARALLAVRVDRYEKVEIEYNQAGKPTTTIQLRASLVDSTGRLLWSAGGVETLEGTYRDPSAAVVGVKASGLSNRPITDQGGAPSYAEVFTKLLERWVPKFPTRVAPAPVPDSAP